LGAGSTADGVCSYAIGGFTLASGDYSMTVGNQSHATKHGQLAQAAGLFSRVGDAQSSSYVTRCATTNATPTEMFLDGATQRLTVTNGATWTFHILVVARSSTGQSAGYEIKGLIENDGGTVAFVGTPTYASWEDVPAWTLAAQADNVSKALVVKVTGAAGTNIRWVASVRTAEVLAP
jgi:hypothetical protein